jgi:hypothetical protein
VAHDIVRIVRRFRRRARAVACVRYALITLSIAAAAATFVVLARPGPIESQLGLLLAASGTALLIAAVLGFKRTPPLAATASLIDRRLGLHDHVRAALQFATDDGAVAVLIRSATTDRLRGVAPRLVFPFPSRRYHLATATLMAVAIWASIDDRQRRSLGEDVPVVASGAMVSSGTETPGAGTDRRDTGGQRVAARPGGRAETDTPAPTAAKATDTSQEAPSVTGDTPRPLPTGSPSASSSPIAPKRVEPTHTQAAIRPAAVAAAIDGTSSPTTKTAMSDVSRGRDLSTSPSSSGGVDAHMGKAARGPGGVSAGSLVPGTVTASRPGAAQGSGPSITPMRAKALAAAALTRDDIPLSRRRYVREYFLRLPSAPRQP